MAEIGGGGVPPQQVQDTVAAMIAPYALASSVPIPASSAPPAVEVASVKGSDSQQYALANHTHASKSRRSRLQTAADGTLTWTYPTAFDTGVVPQIQALVETAVGVTDVVNVQLEGTPTNVSAKIRVNRTQQTAVSLLGLTILSVPASPGVQWVHLTANG